MAAQAYACYDVNEEQKKIQDQTQTEGVPGEGIGLFGLKKFIETQLNPEDPRLNGEIPRQ